ncbi:MAG: Biopolymer transport protein ExbD [Chlamydiae bacterium]|nr:Biopolymer transport protein ExbD [Chlamydiota bacterium]
MLRRTHHLDEAEINLTPLIDVVFVILIMFIVVAPLLETDRVDLAAGPPLESDKAVAVQENHPLTIHVLADNTVILNKQPVTISQLKTQLKLAKSTMRDTTPQLFHDKKAPFGTYQTIKNAVEEAGFAQMDVILKPE